MGVDIADLKQHSSIQAVKVLQRTLILFDMDITVDGVLDQLPLPQLKRPRGVHPDIWLMHMVLNA
jgi:hypothetical protein